MTLVEAALEILRELKTPLTAAQLAEHAVTSERVAKASPAQIKALADRLNKLVAAGELSRDGDRFAVGDAGKTNGKKKAPAAKKPAGKKPAAKKPVAKKPARGKKPTAAPESAAPAPADAGEPVDAAEALPGFAEPPAADLGGDSVDDALASDDEDVQHAAVHALSPEEQELATVYGDELGAPVAAHAEFRDARSADEDRPMLPEINAREERHKRWEERRERKDRERRERRDRRDRDRDRDREPQRAGEARPQGGNGQAQADRGEPRAPQPPVALAPVAAGEPGIHRVGTPLGDAAAQVFAQLRNSQPLPVRQLAAMMRKRGLIDHDPEQVWPHLKAALLGDERSYRALGLRPRIVYRGRDLFAPGPVATASTATAETSLASALGGLAVATHHALKERIARATPAGFERLVHAYLVAIGYRDIEWIKRVAGISYATALAPDADRVVLVSARSGGDPVDRRGVGELRVGVDAKGLLMGLLFAPRELSDDAQRELERPGRSITVVCGDSLVAALIGAGVGVVSAAAPIRYVDDALLDELLAGG